MAEWRRRYNEELRDHFRNPDIVNEIKRKAGVDGT